MNGSSQAHSPAKPRRWFRFSLRSIFVALTLVAIVFAFTSYNTNQVRRQRLAIEQLKSLNATVEYDRDLSEVNAPAWIRDWLGKDWFLNVVGIQITAPPPYPLVAPISSTQLDSAVEAMVRLPHLNRIQFYRSGVHADDLGRLSPLADRIETIGFNELSNSDLITSQGIHHFSDFERLTELRVTSGNFIGKRLAFVKAIPTLERIHLKRALLDEQAFESLATCPALTVLVLESGDFDGRWIARLNAQKGLKVVLLNNGVIKNIDASANVYYQFVWPVSPVNAKHKHETPSSFASRVDEYLPWLQSLAPNVTFVVSDESGN